MTKRKFLCFGVSKLRQKYFSFSRPDAFHDAPPRDEARERVDALQADLVKLTAVLVKCLERPPPTREAQGSIPHRAPTAFERYPDLALGVVGTHISRRWPLLSALFCTTTLCRAKPLTLSPSCSGEGTAHGKRNEDTHTALCVHHFPSNRSLPASHV